MPRSVNVRHCKRKQEATDSRSIIPALGGNSSALSEYTKMTMQDADQNRCIELLKKYTHHNHVKLVHRGNAAIMAALYMIRKVQDKRVIVLIPDQGGWISFKTYPNMLGLQIIEVKTDRGLIDLDDLESKSRNAAAFIFTSFAGYFAEQPLEKISHICRKNGCIVIEDASGAVGDDKLCNGLLSDIIVASFGRWKPVNNGYGGFISANKEEFFRKANDVLSSTNFNDDCSKLFKKLQHVNEKIDFLVTQANRVKRDLEGIRTEEMMDFEIPHKEKRGLNVVVLPKNEGEKKRLIKYCNEKQFEFVECPKYIRIEEPGISIELKRRV